jgi:hypothetical protein
MAFTIESSRYVTDGSWGAPFVWADGTFGVIRVAANSKTIYCEDESGSVIWRTDIEAGVSFVRAACSSSNAVLVVGSSLPTGTVQILVVTNGGAVTRILNGIAYGPMLCAWDDDGWTVDIQRTATTYDHVRYSAAGALVSTDARGTVSGAGFGSYSYNGTPLIAATSDSVPISDGRTLTSTRRIPDIVVGIVSSTAGTIAIEVDGETTTLNLAATLADPQVAGTADRLIVTAATAQGFYVGIVAHDLPDATVEMFTERTGLWCGYVGAITDRYGDADDLDLSATCTVIVDETGASPNDPAAKAARTSLPIIADLLTLPGVPADQLLAVWLDATSEAALLSAAASAAAGAAIGLPIVGNCDGFMPSGALANIDYLGIEVYPLTTTETPAAVQVRVQAALTALGPTVPVVLIGNAYDHSGDGFSSWYQGDLIGLTTIVPDLMRANVGVQGVLWFNAMRPSGLINHPALIPYCNAVYDAIPDAEPSGSSDGDESGSETFPGMGPLDPYKVKVLPPIRDPVTDVKGEDRATRQYQRWFLDIQRRLDTTPTIVTGYHGERPLIDSVPKGTLFFDRSRWVFYIALEDGWHWATGIMMARFGDVLVASGGGGTTPPTPPTPPTPGDAQAPDMLTTLQAVYDAGTWDLSEANEDAADGRGAFVEVAVEALHALDPNWGHVRKDGAQNQYNGHAVDAINWKRPDGLTSEIYDVVGGSGDLVWNFIDASAANLALWYFPA